MPNNSDMEVHWKWHRMDDVNSQDLCDLWNEEWEKSFPMDLFLFRRNTIESRHYCKEGSWVAFDLDSGCPAGFVASKYSGGEFGWITVLLVGKPYRRRGLGSALLERAEKALYNAGARVIKLGADYQHFFPGIPLAGGTGALDTSSWFAHRGFRLLEQQHDLIRNFIGIEPTPLPELTGVEFRLASFADQEPLLQFLNRVFPGRWAEAAEEYYRSGKMENNYVIGLEGDRIVAFARYNQSGQLEPGSNINWYRLFDSTLGGIGPLGVDDSCRGKGYGLGIVQAAVHFLRDKGIRHIVIDWTGLVDFYAKLGFDIWKTYLMAEKVL